MTRLKALLALAAWPVLVAATLASGGCQSSPRAHEPSRTTTTWRLTETTLEPMPPVMRACPVCLFATHHDDSDQMQECVPCAASWAEEWGNSSRPCARVRPLNSPAFNVCPED